jgi:hypothetical protein
MVYGVLGYDIRQPIGGEIGFSPKLAKHWLKQNWDNEIKHYGIDIFLTLHAILGGFKIHQSDLGTKIHKPSAPKLGPMFIQVSHTLFKILSENKNFWQKRIKIIQPTKICVTQNNAKPQDLAIAYKLLKQRALFEFSQHHNLLQETLPKSIYRKLETMFFKEKKLRLNSALWVKALYDIFYNYDATKKQAQKRKIIRALRPLYFGRIVSFIKETLEKSHEESEKLILKQARKFYQNRNYLLKKYKL